VISLAVASLSTPQLASAQQLRIRNKHEREGREGDREKEKEDSEKGYGTKLPTESSLFLRKTRQMSEKKFRVFYF
jgi:hypothetical protein